MTQPIAADAPSRRGRSFLLLSTVSPQQTQGRLFQALSDGLRDRGHLPHVVLRTLPRGILPKLRRLVGTELRNVVLVARTDVLVVHSSLALNLLPILAAKMLGRPVLAFVWDILPDAPRAAGLIENRLLLWLYERAERLGYRLVSTIVIPSADYEPWLVRSGRAPEIVPLWPADPLLSPDVSGGSSETLRVGFAGRVNTLRGLESAIDMLIERWMGDRIELNLFGPDDPPEALLDRAAHDDRFDLIAHGFVPTGILQERLSALDVGCVCLAPEVALPAFPSKTMAYLSAGLPVVFCGPKMPAFEEWITSHGFGFVLRDEKMVLSPDSIRATRDALENRRNAYYESMSDKWFCLDYLL